MSNRRRSRPCDLSLILAAGLALGGCGSDSSTTTPAATPAPAPSPAPAAPAPSLPVPAGLRVSATGPDFIEWSWEAVEGAEGYVVELGLAADFRAPAQTATVAATTHRFTVVPETTAWARVRAVTGAGAGRVASEWSSGVAGASAAADSDGDGVVDPRDAFPLDPTRTSAIQGISTTVDDQILVEVSAEDGYAAHPFDLNGRTLVFTPDGRGGYSRSVRPLAWEDDIGERIEEGTEIALESFRFDFGGRSRDSFHVSRHGLLSFDGTLAYNFYDASNRGDPMRAIAAKIVGQPIVSPLFKPQYGGPWVVDGVARQHVAQWPDRVVVTWFVSEPWFYVGGIPPETPDRFQAVLYADGRIAFHYGFVAARDGVAGLFPNEGIARDRVLARIVDERNPEVRGYLAARGKRALLADYRQMATDGASGKTTRPGGPCATNARDNDTGATAERPAGAEEGIKERNQDTKPPLEHPRLAHSRHLPHQNREVEAGGVNQKTLRDVVVPPKMHPAHPARLVAVRERPLHQLRPEARQSHPPRPPDAPTIPIHRSLRLSGPPPAPPATLRLRYITPNPRSRQTRHCRIAVIPPIRHHLPLPHLLPRTVQLRRRHFQSRP